MNKKIFLTSAVVFGLCCPAFAEYPDDDYFLENQTYENAATYGNLGAYSGTVNATANYENITVYVPEGYYLPAASTTPALCLANHFCFGDDDYEYDEEEDGGIDPCDPKTYPYSDPGTINADYCYRNCTTSDVAHSTAVSGKFYDLADWKGNACYPTSCANGYHKEDNSDVFSVKSKAINGSDSSSDTTDLFNGEYALIYNFGTVIGEAMCSSTNGTLLTPGVPDTTGTGDAKYCWCSVKRFDPTQGDSQYFVSPSWVFSIDYASVSQCENACSDRCAEDFTSEATMRSLLLPDRVKYNTISCTPNTITINWSDASAADIAANNAGQCTFGGDINTPRAATQKTGKRFLGWTFQKSGK